MDKDKLIIVYYISVDHIEPDDISYYMNSIQKRIRLIDDKEIIFIPVYGETKVDCINPKYITNDDLIKKHERLMSELHESLDHQITELNKEKDNDG